MKNVGVHIRLDSVTLDRLYKHLKKNYGEHKGLSLTIERAIREFLDRNNGSDLSTGIKP